MKKTTGKVLSFVLSLALVLTSFPAMFASASTKHTVQGTLSDTDKDKIYLVSGGTTAAQKSKCDLQYYIFGNKSSTLETTDRQHTEEAKISDISHASGDRLVKWFDGSQTDATVDNGSIDDDTDYVTLQLRNSTVSGHEVLNIQYKATYTDDDDNDVTIKASKQFDVYVYKNGETVIGKYDKTSDIADPDSDISVGKKSVELDDNFAEKKVSHEIDDSKPQDSMNLTVWEATCGSNAPLVTWVPLKTASNDNFKQSDNNSATVPAYYTLKSSNSNLDLTNGATQTVGGTKADTVSTTKPTITYTDNGFTVGKILSDQYAGKIEYYYAEGTGTVTAPSVGADKKVTGGTKVVSGTALETAITAANKVDVVGFANKGTEDAPDYVQVTDTVTLTASSSEDATNTPTVGQPTVKLAKDLKTFTITDPATDYFVVSGAAITAPTKAADWGTKSTTVGTEQAFTSDEIKAGTYKVYAVAVVKDAAAPANADDAAKIDNGTIDATGTPQNYVTATVKKASSGSITFTAEATDYAKNNTTPDKTKYTGAVELSDTKDVKVKSAIDKKIIVDDTKFSNLVKQSGTTYVTSESSLDSDSAKDKTKAVKVNGLEVNFNDDCIGIKVKVSDKASVTKISGKLDELNISDSSNVGSIALDKCNPLITVSDAKVGDVDFDDDVATSINNGKNKLSVTSTDAVVGNVTDADSITVSSGKTGNLSAKDITIDADDDESPTTVGNIEAKTLELNSEDSKLTVGTIKAKNDSDDEDYNPDFKFKGSNLTVGSIDFDYRDAELEFDDFQGKVPAPKNAAEDGASIQTTDSDDRVEITGDCDIDSITVTDDSTMTFDGKLSVTDVDGDGTLVIGSGKMYIDGSASGTILKLSDPTLKLGDTVFTSLDDTVDADDFDCYGFTLAKTAGTKTDTFKIATVEFKGLSVNKSTDEIAKGYSATYTAYAYPGGTTMPAGYTIKWNLDGDDSIFNLTTNANGTATVKCVGYDSSFASNDKATLTCTMVDSNGDEVDSDTYCSGECDITAIATPKVTCISDTNANFSLAQGASYQFKITSSDGTEPTFGVGSGSLAVSKVGKSGNAYFYKVTAVGKVGDQVGVYLNKSRLLVVTISASSIKLDTGAKLSVAKGKTYQFKATSSAAVKATTGNGAVFQIVKVTKAGNNTFVTIKAVGSKGQCTGIYFNGVRRTIATVA